MLKYLAISIFIFLIISASVGYGLFAFHNKLPPYYLAKSIYSKYAGKVQKNSRHQEIIETDFESLVQIRSSDDVKNIRQKLRDTLWGVGAYPESQLAVVKSNFDKSRYRSYAGLGQVDEYIHNMEFGLQARMHLFLPESGDASRLVIYHGAHGGGLTNDSQFISPLLQSGYAVLGVSMPLYGLNSRPTVDVPNIGKIRLSTHNHFMYLNPMQGIPVKYFVEPIVVALNNLLVREQFKCVSIFGMSGGGWSATIAAAVDDRISGSYSVAGTTPISVKGAQLDDYEQNTPTLYSEVNHFDMYVLASSGIGRKHFQIHNKYDPAYHKGHYSDVYEPIIDKIVRGIGGGKFKVLMDDTHHEHKLSSAAMAFILNEIAKDGC